MKIRNGFVSNSSTASFIVLIKPKRIKDVEFVLRYATGEYPVCKTVSKRKKELNKEISKLDEDILYVKEKYKELDSLYSENAFDFHELCHDISNINNYRKSIFAIRTMREHPSKIKLKRTFYHDKLKNVIENIKEAKVDCQNELKSLTGNETWSIVSFQDDANFGRMQGMVDELVKDGDAIIILEERT